MAVQLPAPGFVVRRSAEEAEEVGPLPVLVAAVGEVGEQLVEAHHRAHVIEAAGAETGPQQVERGVPLLTIQVLEQEAMTHQEDVDVAPPQPVVGVDEKRHRVPLGLIERGEKRVAGVDDRPGRHARRRDREQSRARGPVDRDPDEGLGDGLLTDRDVVEQDLGERGRQPAGRQRGRASQPEGLPVVGHPAGTGYSSALSTHPGRAEKSRRGGQKMSMS
jgi:hypothetical protein